jgi:hypothetical protein
VGALLDAQPDAIVAHELDLLGFLKNGIESPELLLALCIERSRWFHEQHHSWGEFEYEVPGGWQGRWRSLHLIGDKKGGRTTLRLMKQPNLLEQLGHIFGRMPTVIHVARHPLDNIATMSVKRQEPLALTIEEFFKRARGVESIRSRHPASDWIEIDFESFRQHPAEGLRDLASRILSNPDETILKSAASIVRQEPSRSRNRVKWTESMIRSVRDQAANLSAYQAHADHHDWSVGPD